MIASRGPHKVAVLWPQLTGVDATSALPLLAWVAMTDAVLRTPGLGAIAPDDYHVGAVDGRHVAIHALHSGDAPAHWFTSERRDEVVWLAGAVDGVLRLHAVRADGQRESFDAIGRSFGGASRLSTARGRFVCRCRPMSYCDNDTYLALPSWSY